MNKEKRKNITDLLVLLVFAVFALCLCLVLLTGVRIYRDLVERGTERYTARTAAMYLTTRVRQSQTLTIEDFGGCQALVCAEEIEGDTYLTRVYCHEGFLRELYCAENANLSPADGEKVLPARQLDLSLEARLLTARLDGQVLTFCLHTEKEAQP